MKKRLVCMVTLTILALIALSMVSAALAWNQSDFESWLAQEKENARTANHILGPNGIDTIDKNNMTIILPGDTIAIVPDAGYGVGSIQGGIDGFNYGIVQLNDPEVDINYLYDGHSPSTTTFTEVSKTTMTFPYGNYETDGATQVEYVDLYRNDTGYPVVVRGHVRDADTMRFYTKTKEGVGGRSYEGYTTKVQAKGTIYYAPYFYFVEPSYTYTIRTATGSGTPYEWYTNDPVLSLKVYMDRSDHTYELDNPAAPGLHFKNWLRTTNTFVFPIDTRGTISENKTKYVFNMQKQLYEDTGNAGQLQWYARDAELAVEWYTNSNTVRFHAGDGTINDMKTLLVEVGSSFKMSDYKAVWNGHTFNGWGSSESDPNGTLLSNATADNQSSWFSGSGNNMDVYAAWSVAQYTVRFDSNGGSGSMNSQTLEACTRYTLPANGFMAPAGMEFDKWDAGTVGSQIVISADTVIKAIWKDLPVQTYTISFDANGGTGNMANATMNAGTSYTLPANNFIAPAGKEFDSWDAGAAGSQIAVTADRVIKAIWKDQSAEPVVPETVVVYTCIEGSGGSWEKDSSGTLRFVFKRNIDDDLTFSRFIKIQVDGKDVDESNYTKEAGSVIITLKQSYLDTLSTGTHTLSAWFTDSDQAAKADLSFTIREKAAEYVVPQTGDDEPLLLWTLITLVGLSLVLGVIWTGKQRKIRK